MSVMIPIASGKDVSVGVRLRDITARNLGLSIEYIGFIPRDPAVGRSVVERHPVLLASSQSPYALTLRAIARRITCGP